MKLSNYRYTYIGDTFHLPQKYLKYGNASGPLDSAFHTLKSVVLELTSATCESAEISRVISIT